MNILFIAIDTLRADHLSCYEYYRQTSPNIDTLSKNGTRFNYCFSQAPWTIPSFTTIITGMYPESHRIAASPWNIPNANQIVLDDNIPVLSEILQKSGYLTVAFDNLHQMASHPKWFVRGYNYYINLTRNPGHTQHHLRADEIFVHLKSWLQNHQNEKFFAFVHFWDPHLPYNQPKPFDNFFPPKIDIPIALLPNGKQYAPAWGEVSFLNPKVLKSIAAYDGEIRFVDEHIGKLMKTLDDLHLSDNTLVVLTGDHGESMIEHNILFDHFELYDPTTHVPLIFHGPNIPKNKVIDSFVEHVDILPSILDFAGINIPSNIDGQSIRYLLSENLNNSIEKEVVHALQDGGSPCRMIRSKDWKLIIRYRKTLGSNKNIDLELYSLKDDQNELFNIADLRPDVTQQLQEKIQSWLKEILFHYNKTDPLFDKNLNIDFLKYPGDPVLVDFYQWISGSESLSK
jgi:arylsulfatase A-like enzyme